jgi:hypothetical protein
VIKLFYWKEDARMKVWQEKVLLDIEVILFNDESRKVLILVKGEKMIEHIDKQVIPMYSKGILRPVPTKYKLTKMFS